MPLFVYVFFVIRLDNDKLKSKAKSYISCDDLASLCIHFLDVGKGNKLNFDYVNRDSEDGKKVNSVARVIKNIRAWHKATHVV